jgi:predicted phage terminase large subunit-like protein
MQRLCPGDPTDLFLKRKNVRHVCLPAELTPEAPVKPSYLTKMYKDGLFDPVRLPRHVLESIEQDETGQYGYAGQYLQMPVPRGGGMFKVDRIKVTNDVPLAFKLRCRSWDKAGTAGGGAYTAGVLMGIDYEGRTWILDVVRGRWDSAERESRIRRVAEIDGDDPVVVLEQEPGSGGKHSTEDTIRRLRGFRVHVVKFGGSNPQSKETRADPLSVQVNNGQCLMKKGDWNEAYLEEMKVFPHGKFLDQVDASANGANYLYRGKRRAGALL